MEDSAKFMKKKQPGADSKTVLVYVKNSLPVLELHQNDTYLKDVSEVVLRRIKDWDLKEEEWSEVRGVALSLMAHNCEWVRLKFYVALAEMVKRVFLDDSSDQADEKCLTILCDVGILTEICCHGLHSTVKDVSRQSNLQVTYIFMYANYINNC